MTGLDDRFNAALADDGLAPAPVGSIRRRATSRARRRDVAAGAASLVALVLGLATIVTGTLSSAEDAPVESHVAQGVGGAVQSCTTVALDIQVAQAGLVFVGVPVSTRIEPLPDDPSGVVPPAARSRVVWTFEQVVARKGIAPSAVDVTVEWLDDQNRPLSTQDPDALFAASEHQIVGVLADRLDSSDTLIAVPTCGGYTVPAADAQAVSIDPVGASGSSEPATAVAAIFPTRSMEQAPAIVALDASAHPIAYGDGPRLATITACPDSQRVVSITDPDEAETSLVVWDIATLTIIRTEPLPAEVRSAQRGWSLACLDPDAERIVVAAIDNHARVAVRALDGTWSASDERERIAAAVVLRDPEVIVLATSEWGPQLTVLDLSTLQPIADGSLGTTGDVLGAAPNTDGTSAIFLVSNGLPPPGAEGPTGGRLQAVGADATTTQTIPFPEDVASGIGPGPLVFPLGDGSVSVPLAPDDLFVRFEPDGTRSDRTSARADDLAHVLAISDDRVWTELTSTSIDDLDAPDGGRVIWPFAASAVVGLDEPIAVDAQHEGGRDDPYHPVDATFAAPPSATSESSDGGPWRLIVGTALVLAGIVGLGTVATRRAQRRRALRELDEPDTELTRST